MACGHEELSCSAPYGILVPQPGIEPTSPAWEGGFLTTAPPGTSGKLYLYIYLFFILGCAAGLVGS